MKNLMLGGGGRGIHLPLRVDKPFDSSEMHICFQLLHPSSIFFPIQAPLIFENQVYELKR